MRSGCCTFLHEHVRVAIERRYLPDEVVSQKVHSCLAAYFHGVASPLLPGVEPRPQPLYLDTGVLNQRMLVRGHRVHDSLAPKRSAARHALSLALHSDLP